ncbi:MAG: EutN/CcmL family microcompartment protein [Myxococcales bacterium]|nr:EutN/CcmL family microcompartment protein [Myxococcales bacterium]
MMLGKVVGTLNATIKHETYRGHKILVVQPIEPSGHSLGDSLVTVDTVQAGIGDTVLVMREGNGVRQILGQQILPIRSIIVGVVDQVETA